jgi:hypothetical protein
MGEARAARLIPITRRIAGSKRDLIYSAVMEGDRALPGQEMMARLGDAFGSAGL